MLRASAIALVTLAAGGSAVVAHDHWINSGAYRSPLDQSRCCGDNDCFLVPDAQVRVDGGSYVLAGGEVIPMTEAQVSEDGKYWRCKRPDGSRRCFFAPRGGV
jgi:hypothetical protein